MPVFNQMIFLFSVLEVMNEVKWMKRLNLSIPNSATEISLQVQSLHGVNLPLLNISIRLTQHFVMLR